MSDATQEQDETEKSEKAPGRIPVYIDPSEPEIRDPAKVQSPTVWMAGNQAALKLLRCVEAIRDLARLLEDTTRSENPFADKRGAKILATPLYTLASGVKDLFNELKGNARKYPALSSRKRKSLSRKLDRFEEQVPLGKEDDLPKVRHKIGAHVDKDAVMTPQKYWDKVDLSTYLRWIRVCLDQIEYLLALDVYGWTRDSGHPDVWSSMTNDGTLVDLYMQDGEPKAIVNITFTKSPKQGIAGEIQALAALCDSVINKWKE